MLLPPAKKLQQQKTACIREIQVHKLWTKVYSQKGLTAMLAEGSFVCNYEGQGFQEVVLKERWSLLRRSFKLRRAMFWGKVTVRRVIIAEGIHV